MSPFRRLLTNVGADTEELIERLRRLRRHNGPVQLIAYRGLGTSDELRLNGRVLEDRGISEAAEGLTRLQNLRDNWRRFGSRELVGVRVIANFQGEIAEARTDEEGYFQFRLRPGGPLDEAAWQIVRLELPDLGVHGAGQVLVPPSTARFLVVSDIDDTVLQTYATDTLKMLWITMLRNARTRLPFEGVATLYQALKAGASGHEENPTFYVSSSPWNLYDFLVEFIAFNRLPEGPFFLSDYGFEREKLLKQSHAEHKLGAIASIAATYPDLPLILIGDSGQHDPEIYLEVARAYRGRVAAIYIRHVSNTHRANEIAALIAEARAMHVPMMLAPDSAAVAVDAIKRRFIAGRA